MLLLKSEIRPQDSVACFGRCQNFRLTALRSWANVRNSAFIQRCIRPLLEIPRIYSVACFGQCQEFGPYIACMILQLSEILPDSDACFGQNSALIRPLYSICMLWPLSEIPPTALHAPVTLRNSAYIYSVARVGHCQKFRLCIQR